MNKNRRNFPGQSTVMKLMGKLRLSELCREIVLRPRILRSYLLMLGTLQVAVLLVAFERPAQAYVDPGAGFVFLQIAGSMFAGAIYYLRHRVKRMINSMRRRSRTSPGTGTKIEAAKNEP